MDAKIESSYVPDLDAMTLVTMGLEDMIVKLMLYVLNDRAHVIS